jgi:hypothetical protein
MLLGEQHARTHEAAQKKILNIDAASTLIVAGRTPEENPGGTYTGGSKRLTSLLFPQSTTAPSATGSRSRTRAWTSRRSQTQSMA